jgi:hypothetical protein
MAFSFRFLSADSPVIQTISEVRPSYRNIILIHSPRKGEKAKKNIFFCTRRDSAPRWPGFRPIWQGQRN